MRKWNTLFLALALLLFPAAGSAQELPELFSAVYNSAKEGLKSGMQQAAAGMEKELTLSISLQDARIEEGKNITLTVTATNPRPADTPVTIELLLPQRLSAAPDARWQAVLPAAKADPETGTLTASVSTFTREITLAPGGGSERAEIQCEMSMGTRFYRSRAQLQLCVSDVTAQAAVQGVQEGRLYPGDSFSYEIEVANAGTAPKDVEVNLLLPQGVMLAGALPLGFAQEKSMISGHVRAEAAVPDGDGLSPSSCVISVPVVIGEDVLEGDEDAVRLLSGALRVDAQRVPLPRVQVCGAKISAQLVADTDTLEAGEQTQLRVVLVNSGLAPADVRLSCVLPEGLRLAEDVQDVMTARESSAAQEEEPDEKEDEEDEEDDERAEDAAPGAAVPPPDSGDGAAPAAELTEEIKKEPAQENAAEPSSNAGRMLVYDVHMPAGRQTPEGVSAAAEVIRLNVQAENAQENLGDRLVGASLAWSVDEGETQLGEAVALRLSEARFWGVSKEDWNALFWASVLLVMMVACLCAAAKSDRKEEDFCCD